MSGGLIQLVSIGEQDNYITFQPEITFFKTVYRRHSNFAIETKLETFNGHIEFGRKNTCGIYIKKHIHLMLGTKMHSKLLKNTSLVNITLSVLIIFSYCAIVIPQER